MTSLRTCARRLPRSSPNSSIATGATPCRYCVEAAAADEAAGTLRQGIAPPLHGVLRDFIAQRGQLQLPLEDRRQPAKQAQESRPSLDRVRVRRSQRDPV
jgi:hypothetical protein